MATSDTLRLARYHWRRTEQNRDMARKVVARPNTLKSEKRLID